MDRRFGRTKRRNARGGVRARSGARSASTPYGSRACAVLRFCHVPRPYLHRTAGLTAGFRGSFADAGNDRDGCPSGSAIRPLSPHRTKEFHQVSNEETGAEQPRAQPMAIRASTRKAAAKKKTTRRKTTTRKTGVRKAAAKKTTRRKTATRKTSARKTGTRKAAAKKKAPRRKAAAKKAARKTRKTGVRRARKAPAEMPPESSTPSSEGMG